MGTYGFQAFLRNIEVTIQEIKALYSRGELLKKYRADLDAVRFTMDDISPKISVFGNIWRTVGQFYVIHSTNANTTHPDQCGHARNDDGTDGQC